MIDSRTGAVHGLLIIWFGIFSVQPSWARDVAVIQVNYRDAQTMVPLVEGLLSPEGSLSVDKPTNRLVIVDSPDHLIRIQKFIEQNDVPVQQARLTVQFDSQARRSGGEIAAGGTVTGKNSRIDVGRKAPDGVDLHTSYRQTANRLDAEYFLIVASGAAAYIKTGEEIPFTTQWIQICRNYRKIDQTTVFQTIETGFEVKPILAGDRAHVEIVPRLSAITAGTHKIIRFNEAATRVTVPMGQWVTIGGAQHSHNDAFTAILAGGTQNTSHHLTMRLKIDPH